jgi:Putative zinc-finger
MGWTEGHEKRLLAAQPDLGRRWSTTVSACCPCPIPATGEIMSVFHRADDHQWSQQHLSHYVEGDLAPRDRRRLDRHAGQCVDCGRGLRAVRAMLRALAGAATEDVRAPAGILDRARAAASGPGDGAQPAPAPGA